MLFLVGEPVRVIILAARVSDNRIRTLVFETAAHTSYERNETSRST